MIRPTSVLVLVLTLATLATVVVAHAQPVAIPETWGGDFWSRPRLTGSWGGLRDEMGKKGIVFDGDLLMIPQGVISGGKDEVAEFWGLSEYTLNVDTGKAGLWPGGVLRVYAMSGFGESVNGTAGAIAPVNYAAVVPDIGKEGTALMSLTYMQFFSRQFGIVAGKIYTLDADANEFAHGFHSKFLNTALGVNATLALFPLSASQQGRR